MQRKNSSSFARNFSRNTRTLSLVLGICLTILSAGVCGLSFMQDLPNRRPIMMLAGRLLLAGAGLVAIRLIFFTLPDTLRRNRSRSYRMRSEMYGKNGKPPRSQRRRAAADEGSVLVVVLATLAAISALVLQVQLTARSRLAHEQRAVRQQALEQAASGAVREALQRLADDEDLLCDHAQEPWAARTERRSPDGIDTVVSVADANRLLDLNVTGRRTDRGTKPGDSIVSDLFSACGRFDSGDRVRALHDWVDDDQQGSFEAPFYAAKKPGYACPNRKLVSAAELDFVEGWPRSLFEPKPASLSHALLDGDFGASVTLVPLARERPVAINVNTARREVLLAVLGVDQDTVVNAIVSLRHERPLRSLDMVQQLMGPELFASLSPYLGVRSDLFVVQAEAASEGESMRVRALAQRDGQGRVRVLQWVT